MKEKLTRESAIAELEAWLEKKKIYQSARDDNKQSFDHLVEAMVNGDLTVNDAGEFTQKLLFPEELSGEITEFKYRARLSDNTLKPFLNGVKATDGDGRMIAYAAALTNQSKSILSKIDSADKKTVMSIVVFFV